MTIYDTVSSLNALLSNFVSMIRRDGLEGLLLLLIVFFILLVIILHIRKPGTRKSGLESVQAANNRKILINMSSARAVLERFIKRSTDPGQLREMKNRLTTLSSELLSKNHTSFNRKEASLEEWNAAEKSVLDSSEKLAVELERQLNSVLDMAAIEKQMDTVSSSILNRLPVTSELNALHKKLSIKEEPKIKIPDAVSSELDHYLNSLLIKYANFSPDMPHTRDYPPEVKWEYISGNKCVTATLSNSHGISLVFETKWQDSNGDFDELIMKEAASVKKNEYKCLCLVNRSWYRESRNFARMFSHPKLALYLHELKGGLYYNEKNASAAHYEFWFNTELKKEMMDDLAVRFINEHELFAAADMANALGMAEKGAQSMLLKLEKNGTVTEVSPKSDKIRKYTKSKRKV